MKKTESVMHTHLLQSGWFRSPGAYAVVDGQYGSTGKGLLASVLSEVGVHNDLITKVTTNAGPNSGHTAYCPFTGKRVMTQQLPIASVMAAFVRAVSGGTRNNITTYINGGAIIEPDKLISEVVDFDVHNVVVHPMAAVIENTDREYESSGPVAAIASTGKGVGSALARKILRHNNVAHKLLRHPRIETAILRWDWKKDVVLVETPQGFSLGINSQFYPASTSRECTVMQAAADARIPVSMVKMTAMALRTFPIRVGNTSKGESGGCYPDQREISWGELGREAEYTSVTKRIRRVFTWSWIQFREAVEANRPDLLFINFLQYLQPTERVAFLSRVESEYWDIVGHLPSILVGYGPNNHDVYLYEKGLVWYTDITGTVQCRNP